MELETIDGIINVNLDSVSLKDVSNIISKLSVDAGVKDNAKTILYSGSINGYRTGDIATSLSDVRIIDNTFVGKFLADDSDTSKFNKLLESAIRNEMENGDFDISSVAKGLRDKDYQRLLTLLDDADSFTPESLSEAVKLASKGYKFEPTKGAWAIASEQFIKETPVGSEIICLTAEADLTRTWAQVEIPTALKYLPENQVFGGYTIAELKSVYNSNGIESVQNLLKNKAIDITQNVKVHYGTNGKVVGMDASNLINGTSYVKPSESVFETTMGDIRNYISDAEMSKLFPDVNFENLSELEKLQIRQLELEYRRVNGILVKLFYK